MTQAEKLEALVRKTIGGGWDAFGTESQQIDVEEVKLVDGALQPDLVVDKPGVYVCIYRHHGTYSVAEVLFNHDFVRALFGNGPNCAYCNLPPHNMHPNPCPEGSNIWPYLWEYHLQQSVISDDPIDYMYKAVFDGEA